MQNLLTYLKRPFAEKGLVIGTLDACIKLLAVVVWGYLVVILGSLFWESLMNDYNPMNKVWWFSYCFLIFFGASWLAYIVLFLRDYNDETAEEL